MNAFSIAGESSPPEAYSVQPSATEPSLLRRPAGTTAANAAVRDVKIESDVDNFMLMLIDQLAALSDLYSKVDERQCRPACIHLVTEINALGDISTLFLLASFGPLVHQCTISIKRSEAHNPRQEIACHLIISDNLSCYHSAHDHAESTPRRAGVSNKHKSVVSACLLKSEERPSDLGAADERPVVDPRPLGYLYPSLRHGSTWQGNPLVGSGPVMPAEG